MNMGNANYIPAGRQKQILEYVEKRSSANIRELAEYLNVSDATIRRDLDELSGFGCLERTHGGAIRIEKSLAFEHVRSRKMELMLEEKVRIARRASEMVRNGDTLYLDSGSTIYYLAQQLINYENLTVITNDIFIASSVPLHPTSTLIVTGGIRRFDYGVLIGNMVDDFLRGIRVNIAFLGADAIDAEYGVMNANLSEANAKVLAMQAGMRRVLLADHSKIGKTVLCRVGELSDFDAFITDGGTDPAVAEVIEKKSN